MAPFLSAFPANCINNNNNTAGQATFLGRRMYFSPLVPSTEQQFPRFSGGSYGSFTGFHLAEICSLVFAVSLQHPNEPDNKTFLFFFFLFLPPGSSGMYMWTSTSPFTLTTALEGRSGVGLPQGGPMSFM